MAPIPGGKHEKMYKLVTACMYVGMVGYFVWMLLQAILERENPPVKFKTITQSNMELPGLSICPADYGQSYVNPDFYYCELPGVNPETGPPGFDTCMQAATSDEDFKTCFKSTCGEVQTDVDVDVENGVTGCMIVNPQRRWLYSDGDFTLNEAAVNFNGYKEKFRMMIFAAVPKTGELEMLTYGFFNQTYGPGSADFYFAEYNTASISRFTASKVVRLEKLEQEPYGRKEEWTYNAAVTNIPFGKILKQEVDDISKSVGWPATEPAFDNFEWSTGNDVQSTDEFVHTAAEKVNKMASTSRKPEPANNFVRMHSPETSRRSATRRAVPCAANTGCFASCTPPAAWNETYCECSFYGDDICDCGCGAPDKDCQPGDCPTVLCPDYLMVPPGWDPEKCPCDWYNDGICDCGCGVADSGTDCPSGTECPDWLFDKSAQYHVVAMVLETRPGSFNIATNEEFLSLSNAAAWIGALGGAWAIVGNLRKATFTGIDTQYEKYRWAPTDFKTSHQVTMSMQGEMTEVTDVEEKAE